MQRCQRREEGKAIAPLVFGISVNPIPNSGADYAHHITAGLPPIFLDGAASLQSIGFFRNSPNAIYSSKYNGNS